MLWADVDSICKPAILKAVYCIADNNKKLGNQTITR